MQYVARGVGELQRVAEVIRGLAPTKPWRIEVIRHQERRTLSQNKRYFAAITELARETGHSKDEIHEAMKHKFLEPVIVNLGNEEIPVTASSSRLGKALFSEFMERTIAFAATEFGIVA